MESLSAKIKRHALDLGFDKVGIALAERLGVEAERFNAWLEAGNHAEMTWMAREPEKRIDPRQVLSGARSVIVVALNYYTPHEHSEAEGKISRYAWGDDYHEVVRERLARLLEFIVEIAPSAAGKVCVDTAPVMDKAWAVRAGLGWIGKHTNLITTDLGSWVFIGEILTDLELEPDPPYVQDHCGSCRACIDACPTGAITEPYVVDSGRCISYGTIELRAAEFPSHLNGRLEGWLYGCDICQDVCPWNRFKEPTPEPRFEPRFGETSISPDVIMAMTPETYAQRFRLSAMKRAKLRGLQRNAMHLKHGSDAT